MTDLAGKDIVVLSSGDFGGHPSPIEHLIRRFVPQNRVIYVEILGTRRPVLSRYDLSRAVGKTWRLIRQLFGRAPTAAATPQGLTVIAPFMLPFHDLEPIRWFNNWSVKRALRREVVRRGFARYGVIAAVPVVSGVVDAIGADFCIYYCMDDWARWPGLLHEAIPGWERELIRKSRLVVATSHELARMKREMGCTTVLLPHGVDISHFAAAGPRASGVGARKLVFFGLFDARVDQDLLARLAAAHPELTIELIGPVQADVRRLAAIANITFVGAVPYAELPAALSSADVLLLPYRIDSSVAKTINPLKIREYLATAKPVVAMALPEVEQFPGVLCAKDVDGFLANIDALITGEARHEPWRAAETLRGSSWEDRAGELARYLGPLFEQRRTEEVGDCAIEETAVRQAGNNAGSAR
jgi:glycosyltransferase involved in cell wall biosynthesis